MAIKKTKSQQNEELVESLFDTSKSKSKSKKSKKSTEKSDDSKTVSVDLTKSQLKHLRDLLGIKMNPLEESSISEKLAEINQLSITERNLWKRIGKACIEAGVSVEESAPTFSAFSIMTIIELSNEEE